MDISFSSSVSGMKASIKRHNISAHDIANINTSGYEEQVPHQVEKNPDGTEISHISRTPNPDKETSNTSLAVEATEQIQNKKTLSANAKVIKAKDKMLGEVIDLLG